MRSPASFTATKCRNTAFFPPELYVEVVNRDEVSAIMKYAYENNIPVVCRGAGTGLAGGATCKYGGIMLSIMRMNRIFPVDHKNQTITCEPGALLLDVQAAAVTATSIPRCCAEPI